MVLDQWANREKGAMSQWWLTLHPENLTSEQPASLRKTKLLPIYIKRYIVRLVSRYYTKDMFRQEAVYASVEHMSEIVVAFG